MAMLVEVEHKSISSTHLVPSKEDVGALQKTRAEQVSKSVVLLVEGKDGRRRNTWSGRLVLRPGH